MNRIKIEKQDVTIVDIENRNEIVKEATVVIVDDKSGIHYLCGSFVPMFVIIDGEIFFYCAISYVSFKKESSKVKLTKIKVRNNEGDIRLTEYQNMNLFSDRCKRSLMSIFIGTLYDDIGENCINTINEISGLNLKYVLYKESKYGISEDEMKHLIKHLNINPDSYLIVKNRLFIIAALFDISLEEKGFISKDFFKD